MRLITRDPFGRRDLMRHTIGKDAAVAHTCEWCGQPARFTYAWVGDTQHSAYVRFSRPMCSIGCWRAYEGEG